MEVFNVCQIEILGMVRNVKSVLCVCVCVHAHVCVVYLRYRVNGTVAGYLVRQDELEKSVFWDVCLLVFSFLPCQCEEKTSTWFGE